jgi:hypothetical protein
LNPQEAVTASCRVGVAVTLAAFKKQKAVIVAGRLALRLQAFGPRLMPRWLTVSVARAPRAPNGAGYSTPPWR